MGARQAPLWVRDIRRGVKGLDGCGFAQLLRLLDGALEPEVEVGRLGADVLTAGKLVGPVALTAGEGNGDCLEALVDKLADKAKELVDRAQVSGELAASGAAAGQLLDAPC